MRDKLLYKFSDIVDRSRRWLEDSKTRFDLPLTVHDATIVLPEDGEERKTPKSFSFGMVMFFYITFSSTYVSINYGLPHYFREDSLLKLRLHQLLCLYCGLMVCVYWFLTHFHTSSFTDNTTLILYTPPRDKRNDSSTENTSQTVLDKTGEKSKKSNPFSWTFCKKCDRWSPPRCHHCTICDHCILKRDHHCFFTGVCIGQHNQRFFTFLVFYTGVSLLYVPSLYEYLQHGNHGYTFTSWADYSFPVAIYKGIFSSMPFHVTLIINFLNFSLLSIALGPFMFLGQIFHIARGKTTFEGKKGLPIVCRLSLSGRFREVFGRYWALNFVFPVHFWFAAEGDGIRWPYHYDREIGDEMKIL